MNFMPAKLIDGKAIAEAVRQETAADVANLQAQTGQVPTLAAVLVGENPASKPCQLKGKACIEAGMGSITHKPAAEATQVEVEELVRTLNADRR
jgi:methylenetetrahydrofolate dehydrogenase (NADP+)/methenyltetrahydrofolate cyclohydrolase